MGLLDDTWTRRAVSNALARRRPTYEETEFAVAREDAKMKKATQPTHTYLKRHRVRRKSHKSRSDAPKSSRVAHTSSIGSSQRGDRDGKHAQSARGFSEEYRHLKCSSPRFADYEIDTGRVSGVLCPKRQGAHEWAEMQALRDKEDREAIEREKAAVKNNCLTFRVGLREQLLAQKRAEEARRRERDADRDAVLRQAADWQQTRDAEKLRQVKQFRENREFITQQISAIQEMKREQLKRARQSEQRRAIELKRVIAEEVQRNKSRKLAEIERRRQVMIENQKLKEKHAREAAQEQAREDELVRAHAAKKQKLEHERRAAIEAKRLRLLERETIALERSKGIEEKMREDELRAERDRLNTERDRNHQISERNEKRRKLMHDIQRANSRLLNEKQTLRMKKLEEEAAIAERLQRDLDARLSEERWNKESMKRRNMQYADDLRRQIKSEQRRRLVHPEGMSTIERQMNASLLKRVC